MDYKEPLDYKEIKTEMHKLGKKIRVPKKYYPSMQFGDSYESTFIETVFNAYYYVVMERGHETIRERFTDFDELMFFVFYDIVSELSIHYIVDNKIKRQDSRREMFKYRIELMTKIKPEFGKKCEEKINKILEESPYNDSRYNN